MLTKNSDLRQYILLCISECQCSLYYCIRMKNASYKRDFKWHWHGTPCLVTEMYEINFPLNKQNCPRPVYVPIETTCMERYMHRYSVHKKL